MKKINIKEIDISGIGRVNNQLTSQEQKEIERNEQTNQIHRQYEKNTDIALMIALRQF